MSFSIVFGALVCGWLASDSEITIPGQTTFEMQFSNGRSLVGTVDTSEWACNGLTLEPATLANKTRRTN
jgi:hypothetical protein